ncbi:MAG TPA: ATP-binding protein [Candidatus Competibacteraceae bacterium]|nr:HAMP domain-containing protein [Gammaproteobacteria bacterium]HPF59243.1 ATP-binding protein [Candidatus Competibacteraceae bacterium]HRY18657.1 ATP-binding protein [Candidatus Competibacteraceae bacterium]
MAALILHRLARGRGLPAVLALLGVLLIILVLMSGATTDSAQFQQVYGWLLLTSAIGLGSLVVLIVYNLIDLLRRYWRRAPGASLTLRLAGIFAALAILPVALVYGFSLNFLQRGIDSWFNVQVDQGLEDALELSRTALDLRMRDVLKQTTRMAESVAESEGEQAARRLDDLLDFGEASELTLFGRDGRIIATATADPSLILPLPPPDAVLLQVRQGRNYVGLEPIGDTGFHIRVAVRVAIPGAEDRLLQALFPVTDRLSLLADAVQAAFDSYKELIFLRAPLKASFTLILSLALLLAVLAAFWAAFYTARRLVQPLRELAEGTQAVAAGQFDKQLAKASSDELGFLVQSFNEMTRNLAQARDAAQHSQQQLESQHAYLETVLARLSSGVLTINQAGRLQTCNAAASQILGVDLQTFIGIDSQHIGTVQPVLQDLIDIINPQLTQTGDWRQEIPWFSSTGRRILMCRGSSLPDAVGLRGGHVIVFDDITYLVQAERDAAWAEVARRLAHEIKNPLTPIQLAAERIRHKYLKQMDGEQGRVLERGTHTIVQQVQAMKEMVDAFNEYARPPRLQLAPLELNEFVTEVLYLYHDYPANVEIRLELAQEPLWINADKGRLRQLLHNLVKNAIEAIHDNQGSTLWIRTQREHVTGADCAELSVRDDGPGFPDHLLASAFEPYVTTKPKGTGLGLAVVKKIVEEHGGWIQLETPAEGGARIVIRLPFRHEDTGVSTTPGVPAIPLNTDQEAG